jgi:hypothetical protein
MLPRFGMRRAEVVSVQERARARPKGHWSWALLTLAILGVLSPLAYRWHHPSVRVLNVSGQWLALWVDGELTSVLLPTSVESPAAALELRVPAGAHVFAVRDEHNQTVEQADVLVRYQHEHLYAPRSQGHCFWLEVTGYGRQSSLDRVALESANHFWPLDAPVDTWFVASPEPSSTDRRSSGGHLTALRQARCESVPAVLGGLGAAGQISGD